MTDGLLAVSRSAFGGTNLVQVYAWNQDPESPALDLTDDADAGSFHTALAVHPTLPIIYGQDSTGFRVRWWTVGKDGLLGPVTSVVTGGVYPLDINVSADGTTLYAGGGISNDGDKVLGFDIDVNGNLFLMPDAPFTSPGASPAYIGLPTGGGVVAVGHGTDATVRTFLRDERSGNLIPSGFSFDVGLQGTIGDVTPDGRRPDPGSPTRAPPSTASRGCTSSTWGPTAA